MELIEFLEHLNRRDAVVGGSKMHHYMTALSHEAMQITTEMNNAYHDAAEIRALFSTLTGKPVDESFGLFPPFYTDCGKNISIGKNVFINSGCRFQDQGGITIEDGALIGHNAVLATLNHDFAPGQRSTMHPAPIRICKNVWLGANVTVLPGVTIGENTIVAAGAVVTRDVPANVIVAGVPAKITRRIEKSPVKGVVSTMKKQLLSLLLAVSLLLGVSSATFASTIDSQFSDVPPGSWSAEAVSWCAENTMTDVTITVGDSRFSAKLYDNPSAQAFLAQLPMTITMGELNGNEKYFYLPQTLPTAPERPSQIKTGDLMLYGADCLVLFYETFSSSYNYTPLGYVEDPAGLADAVGRGDMQISITPL